MINSVLKAIDILEAFNSYEPRLSLAEIAGRLDLPKSTCHNLLNTMLSRGYIEKTDDGLYALGSAVIRLTQSVRVNAELRDRAAPLLRQLADLSRSSVYLAVRDGNYVLYIYAIESPQRLLARSAVGEHAHLHSTSIGKAILSRLPSRQVEEIINKVGLPKLTSTTITDKETLIDELQVYREREFAVDNAENELNTYCIGSPIYDEKGQVIAACSISNADQNTVGKNLIELSANLVTTAQEISRRMGFVPVRKLTVPNFANDGRGRS